MRGLLCEGVMIHVYGYHWICLIESFQMSRGLLCEGVMIHVYGYHWICLIESFQMSTNMRRSIV